MNITHIFYSRAVVTIIHTYPPSYGYMKYDTFLNAATLARRALSYSIMGRFNPTALAMSNSELQSFFATHAEEIRDSYPEGTATEEDLLDEVTKLLTRWLRLHLKTRDDLRRVELRQIMVLNKKFYPDHARPAMTRDIQITIGDQVIHKLLVTIFIKNFLCR